MLNGFWYIVLFSRSCYENRIRKKNTLLFFPVIHDARTTVLLVEKARQDLAARPFGNRSLLLRLAYMGYQESSPAIIPQSRVIMAAWQFPAIVVVVMGKLGILSRLMLKGWHC